MRALLGIFAALTVSAAAQEDGIFTFGGSAEALLFSSDSPTPGLVKESGEFFAPRLNLTLDALPSEYLYFHARGVADRGFDPGNDLDGLLRIDELYFRYRPFGTNALNVHVGKFATRFGSWRDGHYFFDDPFILPPLLYGNVIGIGVQNPASLSPAAIAARDSGQLTSVLAAPERPWASTIWDANYATGIAVSGDVGTVSYAFEIKNAGISSHPDQWVPDLDDYRSPTYTGRISYRPDAAWQLGVSASRGPYLENGAEVFLPAGIDRGDLPHTAIGLDARWAYRDFILSGEVIGSQFETLEVGDLRSLSYYLQARWKAAPGIWLAARFGQTLNNDTAAGIPWSPDLWRATIAAGWRITPDLLFKTEFSHTEVPTDPTAGENIFACGIGWRF